MIRVIDKYIFSTCNELEQITSSILYMIEGIKNIYGSSAKCLTAPDIYAKNYDSLEEEDVINIVEKMKKQGFIQLEFLICNKKYKTNKLELPNGETNFENFHLKEIKTIKKIRDNIYQLFPSEEDDD